MPRQEIDLLSMCSDRKWFIQQAAKQEKDYSTCGDLFPISIYRNIWQFIKQEIELFGII